MMTRLCNQLQLLPEFSAIDLKLSTDVTDILKMCMLLSEGKKITVIYLETFTHPGYYRMEFRPFA